jgi:hypothetical protein
MTSDQLIVGNGRGSGHGGRLRLIVLYRRKPNDPHGR